MAKTCQAVSCDSASLRSCLVELSTREASAVRAQVRTSASGHERP